MEGKKEQIERKKIQIKSSKIIAATIIIALILGGIFAFSTGMLGGRKGREVSSISESSLKEVININELSTIAFTYNAVTHVYTDDEKSVKYHVAYEGTVKAGIDFENIRIVVDEEDKKIRVEVPKASITECSVDESTLDYIFENKKYDNAIVSSEAYKKCEEDLTGRAKSEPSLLDLADQNAVSAVQGLIEPWVQQIDNEYSVEVIGGGQ